MAFSAAWGHLRTPGLSYSGSSGLGCPMLGIRFGTERPTGRQTSLGPDLTQDCGWCAKDTTSQHPCHLETGHFLVLSLFHVENCHFPRSPASRVGPLPLPLSSRSLSSSAVLPMGPHVHKQSLSEIRWKPAKPLISCPGLQRSQRPDLRIPGGALTFCRVDSCGKQTPGTCSSKSFCRIAHRSSCGEAQVPTPPPAPASGRKA